MMCNSPADWLSSVIYPLPTLGSPLSLVGPGAGVRLVSGRFSLLPFLQVIRTAAWRQVTWAINQDTMGHSVIYV